MEAKLETRRQGLPAGRKQVRSLEGVNLGILWDDYFSMPVTAKEAKARQRCMVKLCEAQAKEEARRSKEE